MKWTYDEKGKRLMQRLLVIDDDPAVTSLLKRGLSVVCGLGKCRNWLSTEGR